MKRILRMIKMDKICKLCQRKIKSGNYLKFKDGNYLCITCNKERDHKIMKQRRDKNVQMA